MARNPETKGYVSWADTMEVWRYIEWGFAVKIEMRMVVKSPPGEQFNKMYLELVAHDNDGQPVPLPSRVLGSFPGMRHSTVPGLLLDLLYKLEGALGGVRVWAEPSFRAPKVRVLGTSA